jgi:rhomboid family GlyGly-CTERM serine protease
VSRGREIRGAGPRPAPLRAPLTWLLAAVAGLAFWLPGASELLAYSRDAIAAGELWRLVTGHWVHWSLDLLIWDLGAFVLLGVLCEVRSPRRFLACTAGAAITIPVVMWLTLPQLEAYGGLSGIDSALFALLATDLLGRDLRGQRGARWIGLALVLSFAAKIGFEALTGSAVFAELPGAIEPVPIAHLAGALLGVGVALLGRGPRSLPASPVRTGWAPDPAALRECP